MTTTAPKHVRVQISEETIARLMSCGQLCAADLTCLDRGSKRSITKIVLDTCRLSTSMVPM